MSLPRCTCVGTGVPPLSRDRVLANAAVDLDVHCWLSAANGVVAWGVRLGCVWGRAPGPPSPTEPVGCCRLWEARNPILRNIGRRCALKVHCSGLGDTWKSCWMSRGEVSHHGRCRMRCRRWPVRSPYVGGVVPRFARSWAFKARVWTDLLFRLRSDQEHSCLPSLPNAYCRIAALGAYVPPKFMTPRAGQTHISSH